METKTGICLEPENSNPGLLNRFWHWSSAHPVRAILLVSFLAVVVNCYPVIFCGRSFVSPSWAPGLVYDWWPTVPEAPANLRYLKWQDSDTEAMMNWAVPLGFLESRSLLDHGEIPLWNRYSHAGSTLIGQAVSMLGDPLQLIVILGRGSAVAWDLKFLAAKFLFCAGFGLLIRRLTANQTLALAYGVLAAYCGAFFYIKIHPVFFVFTYAPWILFSALKFLDVTTARWAGWGLLWLLVNTACFNAGHVEVAVDLIADLNLMAMVYVLCRRRTAAAHWRVMLRLGAGTALFVGLTAPVWVSFLMAEAGAYSVHMQVSVHQNYLANLPAFFDIFNVLLWQDAFPTVPTPACSLLLLPGCIFSALKWRQLKADPFFWINSTAIMCLIAFIYVPALAPVLGAIPVLNRVGHIATDFSYLLVMHLTIQSAYGFKCLVEATDFRLAARQLLWIALGMVGAMYLFCDLRGLEPVFWRYILSVTAAAGAVPWLYAFFKSRGPRISALGWLEIGIISAIPLFRFGLYHAGSDEWLMTPGLRATLNAPSPAIKNVQAMTSEPFRVVGMGSSLNGDYAAVYGLESICSCAPLTDRRLVDLLGNFPGIYFNWRGWELRLRNPVKAQPLLNLLNVKFLLARPGIILTNNTDFRVADRSDFEVLENPEAWPRAFFDDKVVSLAANEEFAQYLLVHGRQPFIALTPDEMAKQAGLNRLAAADPAKAVVVPATHYELGVNSTAFEIHAPSAGMVCLAEGQANDFTVRINGRPGRVLTVNRAFKGVYLDGPGDYHVIFIYRPRHWLAACLLFWLSLAGVLVMAVLGVRDRHQTASNGGSNERLEPDHSL